MTDTIAQVKANLERKFGTDQAAMSLELRNTFDQFVQAMTDDSKTLYHYGAQDNYTIHVTDISGKAVYNEFDDVSKVEKYQISEEDYSKRDDSFRNFKKKMLEQNPNFMNAQGESALNDFLKEEAEKLAVGQRCEVNAGGRRGEIKYIGKNKALGAGYWVGVSLDEPQGDNDGTSAGKKFFECPGKNFGLFVRPTDLQVGDFPPIDEFGDDDEI